MGLNFTKNAGNPVRATWSYLTRQVRKEAADVISGVGPLQIAGVAITGHLRSLRVNASLSSSCKKI